MNRIDRLICKAKNAISEFFYGYGAEPSFIEALGKEPDDYIGTYPNGDFGYDDLQALKDCVSEVWDDVGENLDIPL